MLPDASAFSRALDAIESALDFPYGIPPLNGRREKERETDRPRARAIEAGSRRLEQEEDAVGEGGGGGRGGEDNPMRARWNENAVTRNKRGDPKLLVEVQPGLGWE